MSEIHVERRDHRIAIVTIDRPHRRNACDLAAWNDLHDAFAGLADDAAIRLAILTGAGGHFCAGDDLVAFSAVRADAHAAAGYRARIRACYTTVAAVPFPVLAAISGVCVGGGASLAMNCDFRIADATARVGVPVARLGLVYPTMQVQRLAALIGTQATRRWLYTGEIVDADVAHRAGFFDACVEADPVDAALRFGAAMIDAAPLSLAGSKMQLQALIAGEVLPRAEELADLVREADASEDFREAARAFAEKRPPRFVGR
jgi:enoyl-CoA hydratase/carnithine racemase